jgi:hypothetical protein
VDLVQESLCQELDADEERVRAPRVVLAPKVERPLEVILADVQAFVMVAAATAVDAAVD